MSGEPKSVNWSAITAAVILLSVAIGLIYYYVQSDLIPSICIPLIIIGVFEIGSSFVKSKEVDQFGTSVSQAAMIWGYLFIAAGGAGIIYQYTDSIIIPIVFVIIVIVVYILTRAFGKKNQ